MSYNPILKLESMIGELVSRRNYLMSDYIKIKPVEEIKKLDLMINIYESELAKIYKYLDIQSGKGKDN